jgi:hypothetical protein
MCSSVWFDGDNYWSSKNVRLLLFSESLWQWLINRRNIMLDISHCLKGIWCPGRFESWQYSGIQVTVIIMTADYLKTGVAPTSETSCISDAPQTADSVQHGVYVIQLC